MAADRPRRRQSQLRATGARPEPAHAASTGFLAAGKAGDDRTADAERDDAWRREVRRGVAGTLAMEAGRRGFPDRARFAAPGNGGQGETGGVGREMPRRQSSLPPGATTPDADILSEVTKINHRVPAGRVLAYASAKEGQKRQRRGGVSR